MNPTRRYVDPQRGTKSYYPEDFDSTEAATFYQFCKDNPLPPGEEQWFVCVICITTGQDMLRFVYPIAAPLGTDSATVVDNAERQHAEHKRPPISGPVEVLRVTPDVLSKLDPMMGMFTAQGRCCDFCGTDIDSGRVYPAKDFVMVTGKLSTGGWLACGGCSSFVEAGDKEGLIRRMLEVSGIEKAPPEAARAALEIGRHNVEDFFAHMEK